MNTIEMFINQSEESEDGCPECGKPILFVMYTELRFCPNCGENNFTEPGLSQMA